MTVGISKIFDRVNHTDLLHKLKSGFQAGYLVLAISFFLRNTQLRVVLDGKSLQEYPANSGVSQGSILGPTLFLLYINDLPDDFICNIAIYTDDTTLYSKCDQVFHLWQELESASELESELRDTVDLTGSDLLISMLEKLNLFCLIGLWCYWSENGWVSHFVKDCSSHIGSIAKTVSKKIRSQIYSMKFLFPDVAPYLYKSSIRPCMEHWSHAQAVAPSCCLNMLDKLNAWVRRIVGPSLATSFVSLNHRRNLVRLSLFYSLNISLVDTHLNWLNWFNFLILVWG